MSLIHFFDRGWRANPNGLAYLSPGQRWTFAETGEMTCRIAHALRDCGLASDARIAVLSPNDATAWVCVLGIWRSGYTWIPINPSSPVADNAQLLDAFDADLVFYHPTLVDSVTELQPQLPKVRQWVALRGPAAGTEDRTLEEFVAGRQATPVSHVVNPADIAVIGPTGGTTGRPKGVMNTHRGLAVMLTHLLLATTYEDDRPVVNLAAAPMTHTAGLLSMAATTRGGTVVIIDRAEPNAVLDAVEEHQVTDMFLPPTVIYRLLDVLEARSADLSSLRYLLYGAAPMSTEKLRRAIIRIGPVMTEIYGQTEAPGAIAFLRPHEHLVDGRPAADDRLSSCGRPYPLVELAILDDENVPAPAGTTGEVCVRGDLVMKGYYKDPVRTSEAIVDGWLHTGDVGHLDADGYLHLTDRMRDVIISGGFNVYPGEIEQVVWGHPAVRDCAVIGAPHPDWGESVTAVVELNEGSSVSPEEIISLCKAKLGSVRAPKSVDIVERLPRSVNGKVLKKDLRERYWANHASRV